MTRKAFVLLLAALSLVSLSVKAKCAGDVTLSATEKAWVSRHSVVRFSVDPYWQPFEYIDAGVAHGLTVAYMDCVAKKAGFHLEFVPSESWRESVENLLSGKVDVLPGVPDFLLPQEARGHLEMSRPYFVGTTVAVASARKRSYFDLENLSPVDIIALKGGGAYEAWMQQRYPGVKLLRFPTDAQALDAVATGQATVAIGLEPILHPMIRQRYEGALFVAGTIERLPVALRMGVRSSSPELSGIIDRVLGAVDAEQADRLQQVWIEDADYGRPSLSALVKYYGVRMATAAALVMLLIIALYQSVRLRRAAQENARQKAAFLSIASHEIRTPLNHILPSLELIDMSTVPNEQRRFIEAARSGCELLYALLNNILDYSKIDVGKLVIEPRSVKLRAMIESVCLPAQNSAAKKGLAFIRRIDESVNGGAILDDVRARQIIANLLSNAIKFTHDGSVEFSSTVEVVDKKLFLACKVKDTGIGIDQKKLHLLFRPFSQLSQHGGGYGGSGLGLTICRELVNAMNGRLSLDSVYGQGTTVQIWIPIVRVPVDSLSESQTLVQPNLASLNLHALVVEDVIENQLVIREQLDRLGINTTVVGRGADAIAATTDQKFDLILLDCNLPDMSGYNVARMVRAAEKQGSAHTHILGISADVDPEHLSLCLDAGMDGLLSKPIRLSRLNETLALQFDSLVVKDETAIDLHNSRPPRIEDQSDIVNMAWQSMNDEISELIRYAQSHDVQMATFHLHRLKGLALLVEHEECVTLAKDMSALLKGGHWDRLERHLSIIDARVKEMRMH